MNPLFKNILAVIAGLIIGGLVNGLLIKYSSQIIPPPEGANLTTEEGLKAAMHLMQPKHFIMPFLAHALGTFIGALIAAYFSANNHLKCALIVALVFLLGGILMVAILPAPMWFNVLDLVVAYIPMGYLGAKIISKKASL